MRELALVDAVGQRLEHPTRLVLIPHAVVGITRTTILPASEANVIVDQQLQSIGHWTLTQDGDGDLNAAEGANIVRIILRWVASAYDD